MQSPVFTTSKPPSSYESAGRRLQALIASPGVQKYQAVTVCRLEHEAPEDWQRLLDEISETAGVRVDILEGGTVRIGWREYCDA
ncbi:DUF1654 domain-containing protein [Pseudomonas fontis]|uniref:DUF1654 domain-containing protein n=1 Tax=Pseudomonas fontis TaxID=2942633 RepID=A0ABT5NSC2_9PSED|nr:DUF1654 domain-containing protein [Pseudomonas fontis]MDD0974789.1 DUF1654 domain-containing protein [Pseudomonas fontis]MDD0991054.1 DUF1654 domain-containing protein [Pseudomonas fontis]